MRTKQDSSKQLASQLKLNAIEILREGQLSYHDRLRTLEDLQKLGPSANMSPEWFSAVEKSITDTEESIQIFESYINELDEMQPPQGKFSSSYLVDLETKVGKAKENRLLSDYNRESAHKMHANLLDTIKAREDN